MTRSRFRRASLLLHAIAVALSAVALAAQTSEVREAPGGKDHPAVTRFTGAVLLGQTETPFESIRLELGPLDFDRASQQPRAKAGEQIEGRVFRSLYVAPTTTTIAEVFRNYAKAFSGPGFKVLYSCERQACGQISHGSHYANVNAFPEVASLGKIEDRLFSALRNFSWLNTTDSFIAGRGGTDAAPVYALVFITTYRTAADPQRDRPGIYQLIVEPRPATLGNVWVDAGALAASLSSAGRVALYGLYFDTNSAVVKPESKPQLAEIAKLLTSNPALSIFVVGHTDAQGTADLNQQLSERRAGAIVKALVDEHGIAASRLTAKGVGMLAPVATNRTEDGRAKNRRVEIVDASTR